jgi:HlyD family secretion protein
MITEKPLTAPPNHPNDESGALRHLEVDFQPTARSLRKKVLVWSAVFTAAVLAAAIVWRYAHSQAAPVFQSARVERGRIDATVSATGACNAVVDVQVGSQVSGNIKALYADFNTRVKAGQLVALIDPEMFESKVKQAEAAWRNSQAALENANASAAKAQADLYGAKATETNQVAAIAKAKVGVADAKTKLARRQSMFGDLIISKEDLDTAQATYDQAVADEQAAEAQHDSAVHGVQSAEAALNAAGKTITMFQAEVDLNQAELNQARIDLNHTRITAPVDGTVVARRMDVGQTVAASFQAPTIFEIAQDLTKMQVDTNVAESDVGRLHVGQSATFTVDAYPALVFQGKLVQIREAPINVQNVITYDAVVQVANPDLKLFPGMTANVTILTDRIENALKLPNAALRFKPPEALLAAGRDATTANKPHGGNWAVAYVAEKNSTLRAVPVKIGITDGNFTEIQQGDLQEGQQVSTGVSTPGASPSRPATPGAPRRI